MSAAQPPRPLTVIVAWFAAAIAVRAAIAWWLGFDGAYGQDPWGYIDRAAALLGQGPGADAALFQYAMPAGYPFVVAAVGAVLGDVVTAAQVVALVAGAALAPVVWWAASQFVSRDDAAGPHVAAAIALLSGQHITWSIASVSDTLAATLCVAAIGACGASRWKDAHGKWLVLAGVLLAAAVTTRWSYAAMVIAFAGTWIGLVARGTWRGRFAVLPVLGAVIAIVPQLWVLVTSETDSLGAPWIADYNPLNAFSATFSFVEGVRTYSWPQGLFWLSAAVHPGWIGPPLGLLALVGLRSAWMRRGTTEGALLLGLAGGGAFSGYLLFVGMPQQLFRHGMQIWVPLLVLVGVGAGQVLQKPGKSAFLWRGVVAVGLVVMLGWTWRSPAQLAHHATSRRDAALTLVSKLPDNARIFSLGPTAELQHRTDRDVIELFETRPSDLKKALSTQRPVYLLGDPAMIARWKTGPFAETVQWLNSGTRQTEVATAPPWTLTQLHALP